MMSSLKLILTLVSAPVNLIVSKKKRMKLYSEEEQEQYEYEEQYVYDYSYRGPVNPSQPFVGGGPFLTPPGWKRITIKRKIEKEEMTSAKKLCLDCNDTLESSS